MFNKKNSFNSDTYIAEKRPLIVTTIIGAPYVMQRDSSTNLTGNDRFEGFIIDVVESISKMLGNEEKLCYIDFVTLMNITINRF